MIVVDTTVWIDFFRGVQSRHAARLARLIADEEDLSLTAFNITEVLQGIEPDARYLDVRRHLLGFPILEPNGLSTYLHAAEIYRACRRRGRTIRSTIDCLIAAVVMEQGAALLHNDRDFDHIAACTRLRVCVPA